MMPLSQPGGSAFNCSATAPALCCTRMCECRERRMRLSGLYLLHPCSRPASQATMPSMAIHLQLLGNCSCVVLHKDVRMPRAQDALERPLPPASVQSSCIACVHAIHGNITAEAFSYNKQRCSTRNGAFFMHLGCEALTAPCTRAFCQTYQATSGSQRTMFRETSG